MIHVCYGLNDAKGTYSKYTGVSMLSIFENTKEPVTVHIFHDNTLTPENRNNFNQIADTYNQTVKFYNFDKICPEKIKYLREKLDSVFESRFSVGTFYRLMIDKNFFGENISKIIYLDSDTVVNLDIAELWNYDLTNYPLAAVPEIEATRGYMMTDKYILTSGKVKVEDYLCAGVIMINLEKFEDDFFYKGVQWLADNPKCECFDQDILNNFFSKNYLKLPEKFNAFINVCKALDDNILYDKIYHYAGRGCLGMSLQKEHNKLFLKYFAKTAWFNVNIFNGIYKAVKYMDNERKTFGYQISTVINGKSRAFVTFAPFVDSLKKFFNINNTEELLIIGDDRNLDRVVKSMKKNKHKKVFFIMVDEYEEIKNCLMPFGFKEYEHFIDASIFVPNFDKEDFSFLWVEKL
jgi:lipopolysaccharide biosynthesis glycosyltransferase